MNEKQLREIDHAILKHIEEGRDDTQKITEATTLETHQVRYSLKKLQQQGLIEIEKPEGTVERVINGQKRVFQAPYKADLTDNAIECLDEVDGDHQAYQDMSRSELVDEVRDLRNEVQEIKRSFEIFRKQVQEKLQDRY